MGAALLGRGVGRNTLCCALALPGVTGGCLEAGLEVTKGPLELEADLAVTKGPLEARNPGGGVTVTV